MGGGAPASLKGVGLRNGVCSGQEGAGRKMPSSAVPLRLPPLTFWVAYGKGGVVGLGT